MDNMFGVYLKSLRLSRSPAMTQEDLARAIGRSKMTVSQFESGKNSPPQGNLLDEIINALKLDSDEKEKLVFLAAKSRKVMPQDIEDYFFDNPAICSAIRAAMNNKDNVDWEKIAFLVGGCNGKNG